MWYIVCVILLISLAQLLIWLRCYPWEAHVKLYKGAHLHIDVGGDFWHKPRYRRQSLVHWTGLTHIYTSWYIFTGWGINIWYCRKDK
jgi:hypothetical protein